MYNKNQQCDGCCIWLAGLASRDTRLSDVISSLGIIQIIVLSLCTRLYIYVHIDYLSLGFQSYISQRREQHLWTWPCGKFSSLNRTDSQERRSLNVTSSHLPSHVLPRGGKRPTHRVSWEFLSGSLILDEAHTRESKYKWVSKWVSICKGAMLHKHTRLFARWKTILKRFICSHHHRRRESINRRLLFQPSSFLSAVTSHDNGLGTYVTETPIRHDCWRLHSGSTCVLAYTPTSSTAKLSNLH